MSDGNLFERLSTEEIAQLAAAVSEHFGRRGPEVETMNAAIDRVAQRAGIRAHIYPHLLRHAFGDHVARSSTVGAQHAQQMLGHADISTTVGTYTGGFSLDELAAATASLTYFDAPTPRAVAA